MCTQNTVGQHARLHRQPGQARTWPAGAGRAAAPAWWAALGAAAHGAHVAAAGLAAPMPNAPRQMQCGRGAARAGAILRWVVANHRTAHTELHTAPSRPLHDAHQQQQQQHAGRQGAPYGGCPRGAGPLPLLPASGPGLQLVQRARVSGGVACRHADAHARTHPLMRPAPCPQRYILRRAKLGFHSNKDSKDAEALVRHARQELALVQRQAVVYQLYGRQAKSVLVRRGGEGRHAAALEPCAHAAQQAQRGGGQACALHRLRAPALIARHAPRAAGAQDTSV